LALAALAALADDGATPIPFVDPYSTPHILTSAGHYVVTRNLQPSAGAFSSIIVVDCPAMVPIPAVTIDLNGMVLDNTGGPDAVIVIVGDPFCEVVIRNGELIGGMQGIRNDPPLRKLVVEDVEIKQSALEGIFALDVENFALRRNAIIETGGHGIYMAGGAPKTGIIEDNILRRVSRGIRVEIAQAVEISNNRVRELIPGPVGSVGISLSDVGSCLVTQNNVAEVPAPNGNGIEILDRSHCKIYNNTVNLVDGHGIFIDSFSDDNLLLDNTVREASFDGIHIESRGNQVQRNLTNSNGGIGLYFNGPGAFLISVGRNYADLNGLAGPPPCAPLFPDFCDDTFSFISQGDNVALGGPF
jgi:parallel beta-helix repeat protein